MVRFVSLFGIACLAVAALALSAASSEVAAEVIPQDRDGSDVQNRLPVSVASVLPEFHAPFSLN